MLFYALTLLIFIGLLLIIVDIFYWGLGGPSVFGIVSFLLSLVIVAAVWWGHVDQLSTINNQHLVISVYEKKKDRINDVLKNYDFPEGALLNADSPIASVVEELAKVEEDIAEAEAQRAKAIIAIEARRLGLMSGIIYLAGDYK